MTKCKYTTKESILKRAIELVNAKISFGLLDINARLAVKNKGDLGQIVEETWFGNKPNQEPKPDFEEAGVELKVSPYKFTRNGVSAKERLVCNIINYIDEAEKTFETSAFWQKCQCICLLSYQWNPNIAKSDMYVDRAVLLNGYPTEDLLIIKHDWEIIVEKIRKGEAHLLTEGDTMYLSACTKGASADTVKPQPFSQVPAKQRAYSLKTTYMTHLLRRYIFGDHNDVHIIKDTNALMSTSFDELVLRMFTPYLGMTTDKIAEKVGLSWKEEPPKNINSLLVHRILRVTDTPESFDEFRKANITVKTVVVNCHDQPEQHMSFPSFRFLELIEQEEWEDSDVYNQMVAARFLFVVFQRENKGQLPFLRQAFFWNMPFYDTEELWRVWLNTKISVKHGAGLKYMKGKVLNSLPKESESYLSHVRPHAGAAAYRLKDGTVIGNPDKDANPLPDGQWMTNQSFWFNDSYMQKIIRQAKYIRRLQESS